jgi:hypothetical protein
MVPLYQKNIAGGRRKGVFFWGGLIAILLLFCLYYVFFLYGVSMEMPIRGRHVIKFLFIVLVYASGAICLRKFAPSWMIRVWHGVYLLILLLLILLGVYDWTIARAPVPVREIADTLQEFLVSPILYVAMRIISERVYRTI